MKLNLVKEFLKIPKKEREIAFFFFLVINIIICTCYFFFTRRANDLIVLVQKNNIRTESVIKGSSPGLTKDLSSKKSKNSILKVNQMSLSDWQAEGFSKDQASMILKFRKVINGFKSESDLVKVYCINEDYITENLERFNFVNPKLDNSLIIIQNDKGVFLKENKVHEEKLVKIDLNYSDTNDLMKYRGVGPKLSKRIIKYRNLLGGFISVEQLNEVYGLNEELVNDIKRSSFINPVVSKLNLNSGTFKTFIRHPYFTKEIVNSILNYRKAHGDFNHIDDLMKIYSISDSIFAKIKPYVKI